MTCFLKMPLKPRNPNPKPAVASGGLAIPIQSESSQYSLVALETKAEESQQKIHLGEKI